MTGNVVELSVGFLQQFFQLISDRPDWESPEVWDVTTGYFRSINLGVDFLRKYVPDLSDFRMFFLAVAVITPLFFTYLGLVFVNPLRVIIWYFMIMFGVLLIVLGATATVVNGIPGAEVNISPLASKVLLGVGIGVLMFCSILYGARERLLTMCDAVAEKRTQNKHMSVEERMDDETREISWNATLSRLVTSASLIIVGGSFVGVIDTGADINFPIRALARGLGWFFIAVAIPLAIWMIMGLFGAGRQRQWQLSNWGEHNFLRLYLLSLSLIYIPICAAAISALNCNDFACPAGTRLLDEGSLAPFNRTSSTDLCVACTPHSAANQWCPSSIRSSMCLGTPNSRLEADLSIRCAIIKPYLWPASLFVIVFFMLGVPYLFFKLIRVTTEMLESSYPDTMNDDGTFKVCTYEEAVLMSQNVARFLYQPFHEQFRFTRLLFIVQKLIIVFTSVFIIRVPGTNPTAITIYCALVIHFVVLVALGYYMPFIRRFENWVAIFMQVALVIASVLSILIFYRVPMPGWLAITVLVLNFSLPVIALVIGIVLEWTGRQEQEEKDNAEAIAEVEAQLKAEEAEIARLKAHKLAQGKALHDTEEQARIVAAILAGELPVDYFEQQQALHEQQQLQEYQQLVRETSNVQASPLLPVAADDGTGCGGGAVLGDDATASPPRGTTEDPGEEPHEHEHVSPKATPDVSAEYQQLGGADAGAYSPLNDSNDAAMYDAALKRQQLAEHLHALTMQRDHLADAARRAAAEEAARINPLAGPPGDDDAADRTAEEEAAEQAAEDALFADSSPEAAKKRRALRQKRRRRELESKLLRKKEIAKELVEKRRNAVDMNIDDEVKGHLNQTIMFGGVMYLLAMCFCVVGLLSPESKSLTAFGSATQQGTLPYELVGYTTWANFTDSCCCTSMSTPGSDMVVEKWVCHNNKIKERLRRTTVSLAATLMGQSSVTFDGYGIRALCSPIFNSGCQPVVSADQTTIGVWCFPSTPNVTGYAQSRLW